MPVETVLVGSWTEEAMISKSKKGRDSHQMQELWGGAHPGTVRGHGPAQTWSVDSHSPGMGGKCCLMLPSYFTEIAPRDQYQVRTEYIQLEHVRWGGNMAGIMGTWQADRCV